MNMPQKGIVAGLLLILLGVIGYFASGMASGTALIPSGVGLPILLSSLFAKKPGKRKLGMHIAVTFGLLGFLASFGKLVAGLVKGSLVMGLTSVALVLMALICLVFVIQCIKSFKAARRG